MDDLPENLLALEAILCQLPVDVLKAGSGTEALDILLKEHVALAILRLQMPGMDGFQLAERMRESLRMRDIPIIFVTASDHGNPQGWQFRGYEVGAVDFLSRPLIPHIVQSKVKVFLALDQKSQELESQLKLSESRAFVDSLIENLPNMVFVKDAKNLTFVRVNKVGEALLGKPREQILGRTDHEIFSGAQADLFIQSDRAVLEGSRIVDIPEEEIETVDGPRILHTKKIPLFDREGRPEYLLGIAEDITDQKRAERDRLRLIVEQASLRERERLAQRSAFLAEASTVMAASLDVHETLQKLIWLSVHALGDWCVVSLLNEKNELQTVSAAHKNPHYSAEVAQYARDRSTHCEEEVLRTGKTLWVSHVSPGDLGQWVPAEGANHDAVKKFGCVSFMQIPLLARGKTHGVLSFVSGTPDVHFDEQDLYLAEELGRRAGIAIDNALLYQAAQRAIQIRDEFLSVASHELKTPITSLKLQLQLSRREVKPELGLSLPPEKLAKVLTMSITQVDRITALIEDMLDVTRIEAGRLSFDFQRFDFAEMVQDVVDRTHEQLVVARCPLEVDVPSGLMGQWDRTRLEQLLVNLLSNAMKYAPGCPIRIRARQEDGSVRLEVTDAGPGIAKEKQNAVFERFERATASRNISGLGLGLFIVKQIVEGHHGSLRLESTEGKGATFIVDLPLCPIGVT